MSVEYAGGPRPEAIAAALDEDRTIQSVYIHRGNEGWDPMAARYFLEARSKPPTAPTERTSGAAERAWLAAHEPTPTDIVGRLDWLRRHYRGRTWAEKWW